MDTSQIKRNTIIGLVVSVLLAAVKFMAGVLGHSSALVADAIESLADTIGSIIVWMGITVSARPPDQDYPYGRGKAEALAALAVGGMLLVAAVVIVYRASIEIITPHTAPAPWTLLVLVGVIVTKEALFRLVMGAAREVESFAAEADAWHHRSDAITSAAAVIGISIAVWGPGMTGVHTLVLADEVAAILASGIIVRTALVLITPPMRELLDAAPHDLIAQIRTVAEEVDGVVLIEKVHARKSGGGYLVDMHLHVAPDLTVGVAHSLAGRVKAHICQTLPRVTHVLIHIEPAEVSVETA